MEATTFTVSDMTCGHCEKTIRVALAGVLPGADVDIDLSRKSVTVAGDAEMAEAAILEAGYNPERAE
jgi:copper chaperone